MKYVTDVFRHNSAALTGVELTELTRGTITNIPRQFYVALSVRRMRFSADPLGHKKFDVMIWRKKMLDK